MNGFRIRSVTMPATQGNSREGNLDAKPFNVWKLPRALTPTGAYDGRWVRIGPTKTTHGMPLCSWNGSDLGTPFIKTSKHLHEPARTDEGTVFSNLNLGDVWHTRTSPPRGWPLKWMERKARPVPLRPHPGWLEALVNAPLPRFAGDELGPSGGRLPRPSALHPSVKCLLCKRLRPQ